MNKLFCLFFFLFSLKTLAAEYALSDSVVKVQTPKSWKVFNKYLDFSLVFVSPITNQKRSSVGILEFKKTNLEKFYNNKNYSQDFRAEKEKWLKKNDGKLESFRVHTVSLEPNSRKIFDFSYVVGNSQFREKMSYYKCGNSTIQLKMVAPLGEKELLRDASLVMESFSCASNGNVK